MIVIMVVADGKKVENGKKDEKKAVKVVKKGYLDATIVVREG